MFAKSSVFWSICFLYWLLKGYWLTNFSYCLTEFRKFVQDSENHGVLLRRRDLNGVFITNLADNFAQSCIKLLNDVTTEYMIHEIVFRIVWIHVYNAWHWSCLLWISMRHKSPMCSFWYSDTQSFCVWNPKCSSFICTNELCHFCYSE